MGDSTKMRWNQSGNQRGYVPFGVEHAKDNPAPDLKEFWQTGRTLSDGHPLKSEYPTNIWPTDDCPEFGPAVDGLYIQMSQREQYVVPSMKISISSPSLLGQVPLVWKSWIMTVDGSQSRGIMSISSLIQETCYKI